MPIDMTVSPVEELNYSTGYFDRILGNIIDGIGSHYIKASKGYWAKKKHSLMGSR